MKEKISSYTKWFEPSHFTPRPALRAAVKAEGAPQWPISHEDGRKVEAPSGPSDSIALYPFEFEVPFETDEQGNQIPIQAKCDVKLTEDDWGDAKIDGVTVVDMTKSTHEQEAGPEGGHKEWTLSGSCKVESGNHSLTTSNENIDYSNPDDNVAVCRYTLDVRPIEPGGQKKPEPCPCEGDTCNGDGGSPSGPYTRSGRNTDAPDSSSAGCSVQAASTATLMYWSCNFGSFRGLGDIPAGRAELRAQESISGLEHPASLAYNHPLASYLDLPEGGIVPGTRFDLVQGDRVIAMRCYSDGSVAPIGMDTSGGGRATLIMEGEQNCLRWRTVGGETYLYSSITGKLLSYTTADRQTISNTAAYLDIKRAEDGSLRQLWNLWDGLLNVENVTESGYIVALYTRAQITGTDESGFYTVTGSPFKTFSLSVNGPRFTITEQTPERQPYAVTWWKTGLAWNMQQGSGEDAVTTSRTRTELEPTVWQLVTERNKNNTAASRVSEIYQTTDVGELLLTRVDGYGSEQELTTQYEYDAAGSLSKETNPDGSIRTWLYDAQGRVIRTDEPWGESGRRKTEITYAHSSETNFDGEIAERIVRLYPPEGKAKRLVQETCTYKVQNHVKRTEKRTVALGATGTRLTVTEQWLASAPDVYARGRTRMTQAVNGMQTWYGYAAANEHGALYTETEETRVNGEPVPGQSTRKTTWITAQGQRVREENYTLLSSGEWALIESAHYEFDTQNRWVKKTRGNGRVTERALMCDGRTLWEKDEDGIRTDYAYDTARQLVETTRSAVMDGETVITPETITSYTRDAVGRALSTTVYAGAMQTTQTTDYDLSGRTTTSTDVLGRITAYHYSSDGLTVTQTTPAGATLVTRSAPDGTVMEQSGTGQRHTLVIMDLVDDGICTSVKAVSGETKTEIRKNIVNGVGEALRTGTPNTTGGMIYTRYAYNAKGQLTKTQVDAGNAATTMAPTMYEYDSFGHVVKETWKLADTPALVNSRITTWEHGVEQVEDGVYRVVTTTKNNGKGTTYTEAEKSLISSLSATLESKTLSIDPRGNTAAQWTEYAGFAIRDRKSTVPSSNVTAISHTVDGFVTSSVDHAGVMATASRSYTETGIIGTNTDARGNTAVTKTDLAGRPVQTIDGAGNTTDIAYHPHFNQPATVTNALGKTNCSTYDIRGRKKAEYGTAVQPVLFEYDDADRMTSLTTFRADEGDIINDPSGRTDGDTTVWNHDEATGLLIRKTYADGTHEDTTYNALNMKATFTGPRGITVTWGYNLKKGTNTSIAYSDGTPGAQFVYNHLNQLFRVTDVSGTRNITYNQYAEPETENIAVNGTNYLLTEVRDALGRRAGYTLKAGDTVVQTVSQGYDDKGRQGSMNVEGMEMPFNWSHDAVTGMIETLNYPNGMGKKFSYEQNRNLLTNISYIRQEAVVKEISYIYDALGRPVQRTLNDGQKARDDSFAYNDRSEFAGAVLGTDVYGYGYDNIGNRKIAEELAQESSYGSNNLNQYTDITEKEGTTFIPAYDSSGNQTLVKTSTGIWSVTCNAENRPTNFTSQDGTIVIECGYDYQGRRYMKKIMREGTVTSHVRYLYRGYLQIAELDMLEATPVITEQYVWEPTEAASKVLLWKHRKTDGTFESCCLAHDAGKNVLAVFDQSGVCRASYDYAPYGALKSAAGDLSEANKWRFSNEYADEELALVYYNYRHYNPADGRWINRDPIAEEGGWNLYGFIKNQLFILLDSWGLEVIVTQKATKQVVYNEGGGLTYVKVRAEFAKDEPVCIKISKIEWWIVKGIPSVKSAPDPWSNPLILSHLKSVLEGMRQYFNLPTEKQYDNTPFEWYRHIDAHESEHVKQFESVKETINKELPETMKKIVPELKKVYDDQGKRNTAMATLNKKWDPGFQLTTLPPKVLEELKQKYGTNDGLEWGENAATKAALPLMEEAYKKLLDIYQSRK